MYIPSRQTQGLFTLHLTFPWNKKYDQRQMTWSTTSVNTVEPPKLGKWDDFLWQLWGDTYILIASVLKKTWPPSKLSALALLMSLRMAGTSFLRPVKIHKTERRPFFYMSLNAKRKKPFTSLSSLCTRFFFLAEFSTNIRLEVQMD